MRTIFTALFALTLVSLAQLAQAQTVTTYVDLGFRGPGTFDIRLASSAGDNEGIVSYAITLTGPISDWDHNAPMAQFAAAPDNGGAGFGFVRTADGTGPGIFSASQYAGPGGNVNLIDGYGQAGSSFELKGINVVAAGDEPQTWDAELLVLSGNYDVGGEVPGVDLGATSFTMWQPFGTNGNGTIISAPNTSTETRIVPEPGTIALLGLGLIGLVGMRRRSC